MINDLSRRRFLAHTGMGVSAAWVAVHWPQMVSAAEHAWQAAQSAGVYKFEFFTPEEALEVEALASRIIPTDDTPGAREAGVIYFIDRALVTFADGDQKKYREGIPELQSDFRKKYLEIAKFSAAANEQQDEYLRDFEAAQKKEAARRRSGKPPEQHFLDTVRIRGTGCWRERNAARRDHSGGRSDPCSAGSELCARSLPARSARRHRS